MKNEIYSIHTLEPGKVSFWSTTVQSIIDPLNIKWYDQTSFFHVVQRKSRGRGGKKEPTTSLAKLSSSHKDKAYIELCFK